MKIDGFKSAIETLSQLPESDQERILKEIALKDPAQAERLRVGLFTFNDLAFANPGGLRQLISDTEEDTWHFALRGASIEVLENLQSNLSTNHWRRIKEGMEALGPQKKSKIEEAREKIMDAARKLKKNSQLIINKGGADPMV